MLVCSCLGGNPLNSVFLRAYFRTQPPDLQGDGREFGDLASMYTRSVNVLGQPGFDVNVLSLFGIHFLRVRHVYAEC
jgi:hypothetical protein